MRALTARFALGTLLLSASLLPVLAQNPKDPHPTITAAHKYGHRKAARATKAVVNAPQKYHKWKQRNGHNVQAWLNKH